MAIMPPPVYAPPPVEDFGGWYLRGDIGFSNQRVKRLDTPGYHDPGITVPPTIGLGFDTAGIFDLGAAALAMYVLIPAGPTIGIFPIAAVFIAATLLGFASHTPAGIGVFDATFLIGLGGDNKEPLIAALLMFRLLYHFLPFVLALGLFGSVEGWRSWRAGRNS